MFEKSLKDKNKKYRVDDGIVGQMIWNFTRKIGKELNPMSMEEFLTKWDKKEFWRVPDGYAIVEGTPPDFDGWLSDESQIFLSDFEATLRTELSKRGLQMSGLHVCGCSFSGYITDGKENYELFHWRMPSLRDQFDFTLGGANTGVIYRPVLNENDIWGLVPHSRWNYCSFAQFPDKIKIDFDRGMKKSVLGYSQYDTVCIAPHYLEINGSDARRVPVQERTENFLMWKKGQKYTNSETFQDIISKSGATSDDIQNGFESFPDETVKSFYDDVARQWNEIYGSEYGPLDKLWKEEQRKKDDNRTNQEQ